MATSKSPRPPLSKTLLRALSQGGGVAVDFITFLHDIRHWQSAYGRGGSAYVHELKRLKEHRLAREALRTLERRGFVRCQHQADRLIVSLTPKGWDAALPEQLRHAPVHEPNTFTVVIFDIPETASAVRQQLRLLLRQGGFIKLQQSVWMSNLNNQTILANFIQRERLTRWVNLFCASKLLVPPRHQN